MSSQHKYTAQFVEDGSDIQVKATAEGEKGPPTFSGVAYSGGVTPRHTLTGAKLDADYIIDLSGLKSGRGIKANLDHDRKQRVGHVAKVDNDGKRVTVEGVLSAATAAQKTVAESAANGYGWDVSIEANLSKPEKIKDGDSATVNGRKVVGPLYVFRQGVLTDLGFVDRGADAGNAISIAASAAGVEPMNEFEKFAASLGVDLDSASDGVKANLQRLFENQNGTAAKPASSWDATIAASLAEDTRREAITNMAAEAIKDARHSMSPTAVKVLTERIDRCVKAALESGTSAERFELELTRNLRTRTGQFNAQLGGTSSDPKVIECALSMAAGLPDLEKHYSQHVLESVDATGLNKYISVQQMLMEAAHANGYQCRPGERIYAGNIRSVLEYALPAAGMRAHLSGFSTVTLPNILGAVANKMILVGYKEMDPTWREIGATKPVSNFYTQNHYRLLDSLEYEEVGSAGEIKHGTLGEETYTSQAKTYAKMLGITRQQIINDDLGAFDDLRTRLGQGAAKKFSNVFWAAFINNSSFFTAALTNYISGSTTTLLTDGVGLGLAQAAFRQMTTPTADGLKRVGQDLNPDRVLVPPELEVNAQINYQNANLGQVASSSANIFQNKYRPVVQWRLSNSSYTGYSTTAWYLFGSEVKPMLVTFLNGQESPTVDSTDADFDTLGVQFRGYHDFGCDKSEYLAGIKSKGAS